MGRYGTVATMVTIDDQGYPHIIEAIMSHADRKTLHAFRATSKRHRDLVDSKLFKHVAAIECHEKPLYWLTDANNLNIKLPSLPSWGVTVHKHTHQIDICQNAPEREYGSIRFDAPKGYIPPPNVRPYRAPAGPPLVRAHITPTFKAFATAGTVVVSLPIKDTVAARCYRRIAGVVECSELFVHYTWEGADEFTDPESRPAIDAVAPPPLHPSPLFSFTSPHCILPSKGYVLVIEPPPRSFRISTQSREDFVEYLAEDACRLARRLAQNGCFSLTIVGLEGIDTNMRKLDSHGNPRRTSWTYFHRCVMEELRSACMTNDDADKDDAEQDSADRDGADKTSKGSPKFAEIECISYKLWRPTARPEIVERRIPAAQYIHGV